MMKGKIMFRQASRKVAKVIVCAALAAMGCICHAAEYTPDEQTLFLAHYNDKLDADYAKGNPKGSMASSRTKGMMRLTTGGGGKFGEGLYTGTPEEALSLYYDAKGNIATDRGTVELWVKLNSDIDALEGPQRYTHRYLFEAHGDKWNQNTIVLEIAYELLSFTIYDDSGRSSHTVKTDVSSWKKGEWHHVAGTWDTVDKTVLLYVDGEVKDALDDRFFSFKMPRVISVGYFSQRNHWADAVIDEVRISSVARSEFPATGAVGKKQPAKELVPSAAARFNFGSKAAPAVPGFTRVTEKTRYSDKLGYGFSEGALPRGDGLEKYPDDLARSYVQGPATFRLNLPRGDYVLWLIQGEGGSWKPPSNLFKLWVDGKQLVDIDLEVEGNFGAPWDNPEYVKYFYANMKLDYYPGQNIFDKYVQSKFKPLRVAVKTSGRPLDIRYEGFLRGMIVYRVSDSKQIEREITALNNYRRQTLSFVEVKQKQEAVAADFTKEDVAKGYVLFKKHWMDYIYPTTVPAPEERNPDSVKVFATQGEYEPATFSIYPLKNLGPVKIAVSDLKAKNGGRIDASNIRIQYVQYTETRHWAAYAPNLYAVKDRRFTGSAGGGPKYYEVVPRILMPSDTVAVRKDVTRTIWLTLKVPEDAAGGCYQGTVDVRPANAPASQLKLQLNVLPLKLAKPPVEYGMFYFGCDRRDEMIVKDFVDMREHGMTSTTIPPLPPRYETVEVDGDDIKVDFSKVAEFVKLYQKGGMTGPLVTMYPLLPDNLKLIDHTPDINDEETRKIYMGLLKILWDKARRENWPELVLWASDEIASKKDEFEHAKKFFRFLKQDPYIRKNNVRVFATENHRRGMEAAPLLDIFMPNLFVGINEKNIRIIKDAGTTFGMYNMGYDRFTWGYYASRVGAEWIYHWHYQTLAGDFYDPFDFFSKEGHLTVYPSPDGPISTNLWEEVREGIDDAKYVYTLSLLIERAKKSGDRHRIEQARRAEKVLDTIIGKVNPNFDYYWDKPNLWKHELYDERRWEIAQQILALSTNASN